VVIKVDVVLVEGEEEDVEEDVEEDAMEVEEEEGEGIKMELNGTPSQNSVDWLKMIKLRRSKIFIFILCLSKKHKSLTSF